jgi:hypothetical protein
MELRERLDRRNLHRERRHHRKQPLDMPLRRHRCPPKRMVADRRAAVRDFVRTARRAGQELAN